MTCNVWTVNRRPAMRRVLDMGVDGVITNRPGALQQVLGRQLTLV
jgi:glycerophosphoryl diester phosphodiesterase